MTPVEYAERYRNLTIHASGQTQNNVRVEIYRIGKPDDEQQRLWQTLREHFRKEQQKNARYSLTMRLNGSEERFDSATKLVKHVTAPFWGKGSPDDCQITLTVAVLLGRTTMARVQTYARNHLGLDCNGFVGNFIWHERLQYPWFLRPDAKDVPAPAANIESIYRWAYGYAKTTGTLVNRAEDINPERPYIMALVDDKFKVIPGGPGSRTGHIVITQPKRFMAKSFTWDSMGFYDLGMAQKNAYGHPALWLIESTGPEMLVGLQESWYAIRGLRNQNKELVPGVFDVYRGNKGSAWRCRIVPLP
ncbi:MAG: hypothetical protein KIT83_18140 [Bryobacterales bacterium]|nr:hypothetical protein [Bryobacterales bacterium]